MTLSETLSGIRKEAMQTLKENIPLTYTYHSYEHTLDVLESAERIARGENISDEETEILKTAAVFHDVGYIYSRHNHEEKSCSIAREKLSEKNVPNDVIERVCMLILATKVPQIPSDKLSQIICDADLDYLGRDDYFPISQNVFKEFKLFGIVKNETEWKEMQIRFLESHTYFTETSQRLRNKKKLENLGKIKNNEVFNIGPHD